RRRLRRARDRAAREARPDPGRARGGGRPLPGAAGRDRRRAPGRRRRRPRALLVRLRRQAAGRGGPRRPRPAARRAGDRLRPVPAVDPPPAVHARALRLRRGTLPGQRGRERPDPGAPLPRASRARGPGAGGRGVTLRPAVTDGVPRMVFLGFGKYVRADKIYALEPLAEGLRGSGARTRVWVEGIPEPIVEEALDLAQRVAEAQEQGRFDVVDLGRRARRLLAATVRPEQEGLF